ncbi:MAG TPA: class I SAM-dependent methyltransferase [Gammaproteobacteria bacterium]|jgi:SAM-dependent methyltransferase
MSDNGERQRHWEQVYREKAEDAVSWFQARPQVSLELIRSCTAAADAVIDVGGGASRLAEQLLAAGYADLTVLDIAEPALRRVRERLGPDASKLRWLTADVTRWRPLRQYALWHDRAVFHFLTEAADRAAYLANLRAGLRPGGHALMASFALDGPERCSGLPVRRYSPESLTLELGQGFRLLASRSEDHLTPLGRVQRFQYSLLARVD